MAKQTHPANPLALAVLALLFERAMHPYEMASTLKQRHKEESIKLRYGSLYTVIELLLARGFIRATATSRAGKRPERTVYVLTDAGREELFDWMRDLLRDPVKEYPQFEAGLCLMPVLPPEEAVALLRDRTAHLAGKIAQLETELVEVARQGLPPLGEGAVATALAGQTKFPPLFTVEGEFRLALIKAEHAFVAELVRRIVEEGWGPVNLWRDLQALAARQHQAKDTDEEAAT
ncbi:MAG TPA: PadR family transcriptional regulator [Xanthobacteraceae bacterium]